MSTGSIDSTFLQDNLEIHTKVLKMGMTSLSQPQPGAWNWNLSHFSAINTSDLGRKKRMQVFFILLFSSS